MFSEAFRNYVAGLGENIPRLPGLTEEEALLFRFCWETLPKSDTVGTKPETILSYVRHGLYLRENSRYTKQLPEELFLQFVLYPRVNSEEIQDCRPFFYQQLASRVQGMDCVQAALEVNRWCAEHMTYQASDDRTEGPLTAYRCGLGRCGEESVFAVSALRSVGLAARQIYVPYWSHCDDNHAWVEVYADGKWQYLGACEPEPVLNRGWFADAASRCALACYRTFSEYGIRDPQIDRQGCCRLYGVTDSYAKTVEGTIRVEKTTGVPAADTPLTLSVPNMGAMRTIARLKTDQNGICRVRLGMGSVFAEAFSEGTYVSGIWNPGEKAELSLKLEEIHEKTEILDFTPAPGGRAKKAPVTEKQQRKNQEIISKCSKKRKNRKIKLPELSKAWRELLEPAGENGALLAKLADEPEAAWYYQMLCTLPPKDLRDAAPELLQRHLHGAWSYRENPRFLKEILCPRLGNEVLEDWREEIEKTFPKEKRTYFRENPNKLGEYLDIHYPRKDGENYPAVPMPPRSVLRLGGGDWQGRQTLAAAVLRTAGVPARLGAVDGGAEYFWKGSWHRVWPISNPAYLTVYCGETEKAPVSLAPLGGEPLNLPEGDWHRIPLAPGVYRLMTVNRLPNGSQRCQSTIVSLISGEEKTLSPELPQATPEEMLGKTELAPFRVWTLEGKALSSETLLDGLTLLVFLDVGKEPTEHVLNELREAAARLNSGGEKLALILENSEQLADPTLCLALAELPRAQVLLGMDDAGMLARKAFLEPGVYPLMLLTDGSLRCYYGCCGYQVGGVALALKLAECCLPKQQNGIEKERKSC